ncbi:MAG TPA: alpha/beta hydrolase [SAR324 cluster bacterium]|nr:alpha/beta hydrolase [SAR324 cluster bacterium]MDP7335057.1 alpha/beta hydrolase [SAR324 cluster bacterium]HJO44050.1 alpha/beta hydrolase [SAR324 cluster bacterium]
MVVEDRGTGTPVIMVHGLGGTSNSFQTMIDVLENYRVIRPDIPGSGRSSYRPGRGGIEGMVQMLRNLLKALGENCCHFVGHSMGTLICQHLAASLPCSVKSLTLFGPMLEPPPQARVALKERADKARREGMTGIADIISSSSISAKSLSDSPVISSLVRESILRQKPEDYAVLCEALSESKAAKHEAIKCPTLLVVGDADQITPIEMAKSLSEKILHSRVEIIKDVGHWPLVENVEKSKKILFDHLKLVEEKTGENNG